MGGAGALILGPDVVTAVLPMLEGERAVTAEKSRAKARAISPGLRRGAAEVAVGFVVEAVDVFEEDSE
jgi:hypothetical protein